MEIPTKALFTYGVNIDSVRSISLKQAMSVSGYLPGLLECIRSGSGMEIVISEESVERIVSLLSPGSKIVGGQAGNMANDASRLGVESYLHTPSKSGELLSLFKSEKVLVASGRGFAPAKDSFDDSKPPVHLVFEFKKTRGIPSSNRFIATCEKLNPSLFIDPVFSRNIRKEIPNIRRGFIAGFHLLSPSVFKKRIGFVLGQLESWREINRNLKIHLEWGSFVSKETEKLAAIELLPAVDSVGFNENEMPSLLDTVGAGEKLENLALVLKKTKTVVLHTRDYSIAFSREFNSKALADSLGFASKVAGLKAKNGKAPRLEELRKAKVKVKKITPPLFDKAKFPGVSIAFAPSLEVKPRITVGLGDCFSMAFFLTLK
jgi:ADP-dependent phosphofructokinase/glucokinase